MSLTALLLAGVPGTSAALTIPLAPESTFTGHADGAMLGAGRTDGSPTGGSVGSISFEGSLGPNSTVHVMALHFSQDFVFGCNICPLGFSHLPMTLNLGWSGSLVIDDEGHPSGELSVIVFTPYLNTMARLQLGSALSILAPGILHLEGTLQADNLESPLAHLQGVVLVPEPSLAALMVVTTASLLGWRRRRISSAAR